MLFLELCAELQCVKTRMPQKYAKNCCHKTFWWPYSSLRGACVYVVARGLDYCIQEVVLSQRAAKCGLHNSIKLGLCSPELTLVCLFVLRHPGGVDLTVTQRFSRNTRRKARHCTLQACENGEARTSVCLTMKNVLLLNSSRNNNSVDEYPSQ